MNKYEFMNQLDDALKGNVSEQERTESIRYYRDYIEEEMAKGKEEAEVIGSLGSPGAIARSIIDAKGYDSNMGDIYETYEEEDTNHSSTKMVKVEGWKFWAVLAGIILVLLFILSLVFKVIAAMIPFVVPFLMVLFVIKLLFGRRR